MDSRALALLPLILTIATQSSPAQDSPHSLPPVATVKGATTCATGTFSSGIPPEDCSDFLFLVNEGPHLDTDCVFESDLPDGRLTIELPIDRYFGDPAKMVPSGMMEYYATLTFPAYDVDVNGTASSANGLPEIDIITFNGQPLGNSALVGANEVWRLNSFRVPYDIIRFPDDPGNGSVTPAINEIVIAVDYGNPGQDQWCTSIDWMSLEVRAVRPVVFFHGLNSEGAVFDDWRQYLRQDAGLHSDNSKDLGVADSFANNANDIRQHLSLLKERWNFEKLNIIAHSKGGLDSRLYSVGAKDVDTIIMVGTPNAGSLIADLIQGAVLGKAPWLSVAAGIFGPASYQLTVTYMTTFFNPFVPPNPNVTYYGIAGDYDPDCTFSCLINWRALALAASGIPGDTIVAVASVFAFGTPLAIHPSIGGDLSATHTQINHSREILNAYVIPALRQARGRKGRSLEKVATAQAPQDPGDHTFSSNAFLEHAGVIPIGDAVEIELPAQMEDPSILRVHGSSLEVLELSLIRHNGSEILPSSLPAGILYDGGDTGFGVKIYGFSLEGGAAAQVKALRIRAVSATNPGQTEAGYVLHGLGGPQSPTLEVTLPSTPLADGDDLPVSAKVLSPGGSPLSSATISARLTRADQPGQFVSLNDAGATPDPVASDGVFSGTLSAQEGIYALEVMAEFPTGGGSSTLRVASAALTVGPRQDPVPVTFQATTTDADGDALHDQLTIKALFDGLPSGSYLLNAELATQSGNRLPSSAQIDVDAATQSADFAFPGEDIRAFAEDGPYLIASLTAVRVAEDDQFIPVPLALDSFQTAPFSYRDFQRKSILLGQETTAEGADDNEDGLFETLQVTLVIDVLQPGAYSWSGVLRDNEGTEVAFGVGSGPLAAGENDAVFTFPGVDIGRATFTPPLIVTDIIVVGPLSSRVFGDSLDVGTFSPTQFAGCDDLCRIERFLLGEPPAPPLPHQNQDQTLDAADLLLALGRPGSGVSFSEPDNSFYESNPLTIGSTPLQRAIDPQSDEDWFHLTVANAANGTFRIDDAPERAASLFVYTAGLRFVGSYRTTSREGDLLLTLPLLSGEYYVRVNSADRATLIPTYHLSATAAPLNPLPLNGTPVNGSISQPGMVEFFHIELVESAGLTIETTGEVAADTVIYLFDSTYTVVESDDDGGSGSFSLITSGVLPPGEYFLAVRAFSSSATIEEYQVFAQLTR